MSLSEVEGSLVAQEAPADGLYGEDESGPCTGDERKGQGASSFAFIQRRHQRIMGREGRDRAESAEPRCQAEASKSQRPQRTDLTPVCGFHLESVCSALVQTSLCAFLSASLRQPSTDNVLTQKFMAHVSIKGLKL